MKKLRSIGCLIVLILSVLNLKIALGQGEENLNNDQDVTLEVDGGFLTLMIPAEYQYQTVELTELECYPFSYTFMNEETGIRFTVYSIVKKIRAIFSKSYTTRATDTSFLRMS